MSLPVSIVEEPARVVTVRALLWSTTFLLLLWHAGAHVDAWYHAHQGFEIESFLTWPHAMMYAGWAGSGLLVTVYLIESIRRGFPRRAWLPPGFTLVLVGAALFGLGGIFDFFWHAAFGFEARLETLLTPAHLWLVAASALAFLGLVQAGLVYRASEGRMGKILRLTDLPAVLGLAFLLRTVLWNTMYSDPLVMDYVSDGNLAGHLHATEGMGWDVMAAQVAGTSGVVLHTAVLVLFLVLVTRRLQLPGGAIAIVMLMNGTLSVLVTGVWAYLPAVGAGALVGELLWAGIRRGRLGGPEQRWGYWVLGAAVPFAQFTAYLVLVAAFGGGTTWAVHLWAGIPFMAAFFGVVTAILVAPPRALTSSWTRVDDQVKAGRSK